VDDVVRRRALCIFFNDDYYTMAHARSRRGRPSPGGVTSVGESFLLHDLDHWSWHEGLHSGTHDLSLHLEKAAA
jgi:hypothetical protein